MKNVSNKSCREIQNTYFMFNTFFFPESLTIYEIKNTVEPEGGGGHK